MRLRFFWFFSLLLCLDCSGGFCASSKIQVQLELRHDFKKEERLKEIRKTLGKFCQDCQVKNKSGDYRMIFTVNRGPQGENQKMLWEVRDRNNKKVGHGWTYATWRAVAHALNAMRQDRDRLYRRFPGSP